MIETTIDPERLTEISGRFIADGFAPDEADRKALEVITGSGKRSDPAKPETLAELVRNRAAEARFLEAITPQKAKFRPVTEAGLAEAFADMFDGRLLFVPELKAWHHFDGTRWILDAHGLAMQAAKILIRALTLAAYNIDDREKPKKLATFEKAKSLSAILTIAATEPRLVRPLADFDADPFELNTPAGLVDLRTGRIAPHSPRQLVTKIAGASPDFTATAPTFEKFLLDISDGRKELASWMLDRMGYYLTGDTALQDFAEHVGTGANGKSIKQRMILAILKDYAGSIDPSILISADKRRGGPNAELLDTRGKRVVFATETGDGDRLDTSRVKALTGEDEQAARALFSNLIVRFTPTAKIIISTNTAPGLDSVDHAIRRRILLVPFDRTFAGADRDPAILDKLLAERDAILGQMVRAAMRYATSRAIPYCEIVDAASTAYVNAQDQIGRWIEDRCRIRADALTPAGMLYNDFRNWQEADGIRVPWTQTRFGLALSSHGYEKDRTGATKYRRGLELLPD